MSIKKTDRFTLKMVLSVVIAIILLFLLIAKGTSELIASNVRDSSYEHYQLLANDTAETLNSWLASKKEIVENQRAAIEMVNNFDIEYLSTYLAHAIVGRKDLNEICDLYFLNKEGKLSTANGFYTSPDVDLRFREWYTECLDTRDMYYSSPYLDLSTGNYVVTLSVAMHDKSGKFMGVLALDLYIDAFMDTVSFAKVPEHSYLFLIDGNFGIASHPNPAYGYVNNEPILIDEMENRIYADVENTIKRGKYERIELNDYDGVRRDMFSSNINCCDWSVVAAISDDVMRSSERLMVIYIIAALFISLAVGILWTLIGTRRIMKQLSDAMTEANSANETKSSFLANMSHEIRTPINAVIGMNEMVLREDVSDTVRDYSLDIAAASRSLIAIINDILDFSKIESGKLEIVESEFNIGSMISEIVSMSVSRLGEKDLELFVRVDPTIPAGIIGDEIRIKQIIVNLMTNGIKYTNEGFVSLNVSYTKRDYGINLDVSVKDSGIGISQENLDKLFTSFQQIDTKRNRSVEGTGLGLAITKRLVEQMGGYVNVKSEYGIGSEFRISIPLKTDNNAPIIRIIDPVSVHAVCMFSFEGYGVDVVDEYIRTILEMGKLTQTDITICTDIGRLKRLVSDGALNVLFIDRFNYIEHEKYITSLTDRINVVLVQNRMNTVTVSDKIRCVYKPFYAIPYASVLNNESTSQSAGSSAETSSAFVAPDARILIVDDNIVNLKVAVGLMKPYQMQIFTADSGEKAIEMIDNDPSFDIIFMDHMMPGMDGVEATGLLRSRHGDYYRNVPIIALTANTVNGAREMFLESGFNDFLAKPIDVSMLDRLLRKFLPAELRKAITEAVSSPASGNSRTSSAQKEQSPLFDTSIGIKYTGNDKELYLEVLTQYVRESSGMKEALSGSLENKAWNEYTIKVHALKSTSLNIGAVQLSELAKKLELSGKAGDYQQIEDGNESLLSLYDKVCAEAVEYLSKNGIEVITDTRAEYDDISNLEEIDKAALDSLIDRFTYACENYDRETAAEIAVEAEGRKYGDTVLGDVFAKAAAYIEEFKYDEAAETVLSLREGAEADD